VLLCEAQRLVYGAARFIFTGIGFTDVDTLTGIDNSTDTDDFVLSGTERVNRRTRRNPPSNRLRIARPKQGRRP
jgi:hypothetical protein